MRLRIYVAVFTIALIVAVINPTLVIVATPGIVVAVTGLLNL